MNSRIMTPQLATIEAFLIETILASKYAMAVSIFVLPFDYIGTLFVQYSKV